MPREARPCGSSTHASAYVSQRGREQQAVAFGMALAAAYSANESGGLPAPQGGECFLPLISWETGVKDGAAGGAELEACVRVRRLRHFESIREDEHSTTRPVPERLLECGTASVRVNLDEQVLHGGNGTVHPLGQKPLGIREEPLHVLFHVLRTSIRHRRSSHHKLP